MTKDPKVQKTQSDKRPNFHEKKDPILQAEFRGTLKIRKKKNENSQFAKIFFSADDTITSLHVVIYKLANSNQT